MGQNSKRRNRAANGQWYTTNLDKVCKRCGHTLGEHDAAKPYAQDDLMSGFECEGFKK